ncbi:ADP-ribosylglycohydrolase family protein [Microbispora triticiradicis]|uniref:ADP-ribosylglycohydrolase family protein n=1 Tax=Microbispora triticiradicis TaxID=2200763 RepID=UPI0027DD8A96|nr:ADP-ribosylglycohydrolase family protein [Microbispora triticiradicis]
MCHRATAWRALCRGVAAHREKVESLGAGWVAEEALAIAVYCALAQPDPREALLLAVDHSGDSDSTGVVCGNILGPGTACGRCPPIGSTPSKAAPRSRSSPSTSWPTPSLPNNWGDRHPS